MSYTEKSSWEDKLDRAIGPILLTVVIVLFATWFMKYIANSEGLQSVGWRITCYLSIAIVIIGSAMINRLSASDPESGDRNFFIALGIGMIAYVINLFCLDFWEAISLFVFFFLFALLEYLLMTVVVCKWKKETYLISYWLLPLSLFIVSIVLFL